jgi:hypothetical protein
VHGNSIRHLEDVGGQRLIGDWFDPAAFVTWDIALPVAGTYAVEIRYGAPEDSSGRRFGIRIDGGGDLEGRIWNTGSWTSLSPWLPLGRLHVPAGHRTLAVHAAGHVALAMNLQGLRLIPAGS